MVIVGLMGGLGNQMFQYAAARRLAFARQTSVKLDLSWYLGQTLRSYRLNHFNTQVELATPEEINQLTGQRYRRLRRFLFYLWQRLKPYSRRSLVREQSSSHFDRRILSMPDNVYLWGYWQSERYFQDASDLIRAEFTPREGLDDYGQDIARQITGTTSVAVHVRRGDYVANPRTHNYHGTCTVDYYRQSVHVLAEKHPRLHLFVFSDDPNWVVSNLDLGFPMTVLDQTDKEYQDLWLMSLCQHFIIANSSFSWWGAWLSRNPSKLVLAPHRWFAKKSSNSDDRIPIGWHKI